jgi:hypothetical protein
LETRLLVLFIEPWAEAKTIAACIGFDLPIRIFSFHFILSICVLVSLRVDAAACRYIEFVYFLILDKIEWTHNQYAVFILVTCDRNSKPVTSLDQWLRRSNFDLVKSVRLQRQVGS